MHNNTKKVIAFDLDETIGHFEELDRFMDGLSALHEGKQFSNPYTKDAFEHIAQKHFNKILDLYPEFFRPHIFKIFKNLSEQKKKKNLKVVIYTNNMAPRSWTLYIKNYIENKIGRKLFDKVITGYRPREKGNCRTTHNKTHEDFVKCMNLSPLVPIVFFDDQYHPRMHHDNIHYVHLVPYNRGIAFLDMIKRFMKANEKGTFGKAFKFIPSMSDAQFIKTMYHILERLGRRDITYKVKHTKNTKKDFEETRRIKRAITHFIGKKSRKRKRKIKRKTRRRLF